MRPLFNSVDGVVESLWIIRGVGRGLLFFRIFLGYKQKQRKKEPAVSDLSFFSPVQSLYSGLPHMTLSLVSCIAHTSPSLALVLLREPVQGILKRDLRFY